MSGMRTVCSEAAMGGRMDLSMVAGLPGRTVCVPHNKSSLSIPILEGYFQTRARKDRANKPLCMGGWHANASATGND